MDSYFKSNAEAASKIKFELDFIEASLMHIDFLARVDQRPCLFSGKYFEQAFQRYEQLWMPLVAGNKNTTLVAPLDIQWLWHCHMLAPNAYKKDCIDTFGRLIDHRLLNYQERKKHLKFTQILWEKEYPSEQFYVDLPLGIVEADTIDIEIWHSKFSYDIRSAASRQCSFFYNVSLPHYRDRKYLSISVLRYKKFLHLKSLHKDSFLVPCYDNDLVWHTHQLFPVQYRSDTHDLLGKVLNHDDSTTDRSEGSFLKNSFQATCKLWRDTYGENYQLPGGMYRGVTSRNQMNRYSPPTTHVDDSFDIDQFSVTINCIYFDRNPGGSSAELKLDVLLDNKTVLDLSGSMLSWLEEDTGEPSVKVCRTNQMAVRVSKLLDSTVEFLSEVPINIYSMLNKVVYMDSSDFQEVVSFSTECCQECTLYILGRVRRFTQNTKLQLKIGAFKECNIPANLEQEWDPVVSNPEDMQDTRCFVAEHRQVKQCVFCCCWFNSKYSEVVGKFTLYI